MTPYFQRLFTRYPIKTHRFLELIPGLASWTIILAPIWGTFFFPVAMAYFIILFDVYWMYKSFSLVVTAHIASKKIKVAEKINWLEKAEKLDHFDKVHHVLIIPNYKEKVEKLRTTIEAIANQTMPTKQIHVVLGMEEREEDGKEKAQILINEFKDIFGSIFATYHPDVPGEVKGKSSNESFAGKESYKKLVTTGKIDINYATISSVDADSIFNKHHFAYVSYLFLTDENRYYKFWQSATVFYNNIWKVPSPIRIISFFGSLYRTALLIQGDRLITQSTYTLSFKMLHDIGYWDVDVIPEDYRIFFKAFYALKGKVSAVPVFLQTSMDAAHSQGYMNSLKNKYHQERRWSWGVSDHPIFIKWYLTVPGVPFTRKTMLLFHVMLDHILWPVNWFIITIAANIMPLVNPVFSRTALGYELPRLAGSILTFCLLAIIAMIVIEYRHRSKEVKLSKWRQFLFPFEFVLMPIVGFFLSALPALISHTSLMFGKRLEYKVTDKV